MIEHQKKRCRFSYLDCAIFQPLKIKLVLSRFTPRYHEPGGKSRFNGLNFPLSARYRFTIIICLNSLIKKLRFLRKNQILQFRLQLRRCCDVSWFDQSEASILLVRKGKTSSTTGFQGSAILFSDWCFDFRDSDWLILQQQWCWSKWRFTQSMSHSLSIHRIFYFSVKTTVRKLLIMTHL